MKQILITFQADTTDPVEIAARLQFVKSIESLIAASRYKTAEVLTVDIDGDSIGPRPKRLK